MSAEQRFVRHGDDLVLGYPAGADRTPWSALPPASRQRLIDDALRGPASLTGNWTIVGARGGALVVRTDDFGSRPVFVVRGRDESLVMEDIWCGADHMADLDPAGIADFLMAGRHLGARTAFSRITAAESDTLITITPEALQTRVFAPRPPGPRPRSMSDAIDRLVVEFDRMHEPYADLSRLLIPLSGGLDSRVLAAVASDRQIDAYAWTFAAKGGTREEQIARRVAGALNMPQTVTEIDHESLNEHVADYVRSSSGHLSLENFHAHGLHRGLPSEYDVASSGLFGDVICGGSFLLKPEVHADGIETGMLRQLTGYQDPFGLEARYFPGVPGWAESLQDLVSRLYGLVNRDPARSDYIVLRQRPGRFTVYGMISKRSSFDYISPFLDADLCSLCYSMPTEWRRDSLAYRHAIARQWPRLGTVPWAKTGLPLTRRPGRAHALREKLRRRLPGAKPTMFTSPVEAYAARKALVDEAVPRLEPLLRDSGIDLVRLLSDVDESSPFGRQVRLRLATLYLTFVETGHLQWESAGRLVAAPA